MNTHRAVQVPPSIRRSAVQAIPSAQVRGHAPAPLTIAVSHDSPPATTPSPQAREQSGSFIVAQPEGQHPSEPMEQTVTAFGTQAAEQSPVVP